MIDLTLEKVNIGFAVNGAAVFVWASIHYSRFIKFWMLRPAPYSKRVTNFFRSFFLACVIGSVWHLVDTTAGSGRPVMFYLSSLPVAVAWFAVFFVMLHAVEWMNPRRRAKQSQEQRR